MASPQGELEQCCLCHCDGSNGSFPAERGTALPSAIEVMTMASLQGEKE